MAKETLNLNVLLVSLVVSLVVASKEATLPQSPSFFERVKKRNKKERGS